MKTFEVIQDTLSSPQAKQNVIEWSNKIYSDLQNLGAVVQREELRELTFSGDEPCKSYRVRFYIDKYAPKPTFADMKDIVSKTKAVCFDNVKQKKITIYTTS